MFLDANIFIHAYSEPTQKGRECTLLLEKVKKGEQNATTSGLVVNEVLYYFAVHYGPDKVERVHKSITTLENISMLPVNDRVTAKAIDFIRQGLEITDAFHAATMSVNHIETICSYDGGFDSAKGIKRQVPK